MIGVVAAACIVAVLVAQAGVVNRLRGAGGHHGVSSRRRRLRRSLAVASAAMVVTAVGMLGYPLFTDVYAGRLQDELERELTSDELRQDYEVCRTARADTGECPINDGDSLTRIRIPAIEVDVVVVEGVSDSALRAGAGHYPSTPLPCETGNVAIAGHRTTYGQPFHDVDQLQPGDDIFLRTPLEECRYQVAEQKVVDPTDVSVIQASTDSWLTLTTCHPKGSASERLVIHAHLVGFSEPPA